MSAAGPEPMDDAMDHALIDGDTVVDRYLMGRLAPDEAERFERHYLSCPRCLEQLEVGEQLIDGLRHAAVRDVAPGRSERYGRAPARARAAPGQRLARGPRRRCRRGALGRRRPRGRRRRQPGARPATALLPTGDHLLRVEDPDSGDPIARFALRVLPPR